MSNGLGHGLLAAVNGFKDGREWRTERDDKKKADERAGVDRDYELELRRRQSTEWNRSQDEHGQDRDYTLGQRVKADSVFNRDWQRSGEDRAEAQSDDALAEQIAAEDRTREIQLQGRGDAEYNVETQRSNEDRARELELQKRADVQFERSESKTIQEENQAQATAQNEAKLKAIQGSGPAMAPLPAGATPTQISNGINSYVDRYNTTIAPKVIEHYMKIGQPEKAKSYQDFLSSGNTQQAQKDYAAAMVSAQMGDSAALRKYVIRAYNNSDYLTDGFDLVPGKTGLTTGEDGSITGATLAFKNKETGETNVMQLNSMNEIQDMLAKTLSPEAVFEQQQSQRAGAAAINDGELKQDRAIELAMVKAYAGQKPPPAVADQINAAIKILSDSDTDFGGTFNGKTAEEKIDMALDFIAYRKKSGEKLEGGGGTPTSEVPVYR